MHLLPLFTAALMCMHNITFCHFLRASAIARSESMDDIWPPIHLSVFIKYSCAEARKTLEFKLFGPLSSSLMSEVN